MSSLIELPFHEPGGLRFARAALWLPLLGLAILVPGLSLPLRLLLASGLVTAVAFDVGGLRRSMAGTPIDALRLLDGGLEARCRDGHWHQVQVQGASRLFARAVILKIRIDQSGRGSQTLVLSSVPIVANIQPEVLRKLRARLNLTELRNPFSRKP